MTYQEVTLDIEKLAAMRVVDREWLKNLTVTTSENEVDFIRNTLAVQMVRHIATVGGESVTVPEIKVPDGLWQAVKERFGGPLLRWSPVRYRVLQHEQTWQAAELLPSVDLPDDYRHGARRVMIQRWP